MARSSSLRTNGRSPAKRELGARVCRLDFRPSRFFGCRVERVLADFFASEHPQLEGIAEAFWDLTQGTIRPGLDDRVTLDANFSPELGRGHVTMTLFYRLPCIETALIEKVLKLLDRRSTRSSYYRFGRAKAASVRATTHVRTSVVGEDEGESYLVSTMVLGVRAIIDSEESGSAQKDGPCLEHRPL